MNENEAVLVIGAGIAGIQASIDLANMGFRVHLVERTPSIGGRMAQLDKTFPTNDCAMCILAPKMIECAGHENVNLLTYAEVVEVEGQANDFRVKVLQKPRFIDSDKCTGCSECAQVCPVSVPSGFDVHLGTRKAIYRPFVQAVPNVYLIEKEGIGPCRHACPAGTNANAYVALITEGRFAEALAVIKETNPFPASVGRVCHHPCEAECNRGKVDEPVAICDLKRFAADWVYEHGEEEKETGRESGPPTPSQPPTQKVAIVGSGPAGLSAAYFLARAGYGVTVFEALPVAGGMMRVGIPAYRLPPVVLEREINDILSLEVELRLNAPVRDINALFEEGYGAVLLTLGAHQAQKLGIPGEDTEGVYYGVSFLRAVSLGEEVQLGDRIVVIGGGNTAIDAAGTALRLGRKPSDRPGQDILPQVTVIYRRSRREMPAFAHEVEEAEREGIRLECLAAPVSVLSEGGRVTGLRCMRMELGEPDSSGRRRPIPIEGSEFAIEADTVIAAVAQRPQISLLKEGHGLEITRWGTLAVDPNTLATNRPGVFAAGDAARGGGTVIEAIAAGHRAALSIERYLKGEELFESHPAKEEQLADPLAKLSAEEVEQLRGRPRQTMPALPVRQRVTGFEEVALGFDEETARREAQRCLNCAVCSECRQCEVACQAKAILHDMRGRCLELNHIGAIIVATGYDFFDPSPLEHYGYKRCPNVITSMEYERLISASGPTGGELRRPSDQRVPERLAFIQCVGSRDVNYHPYCSSVCCMYATKEAILAREHYPRLKAVIFYTDLRAVGKRFQRYITRARQEYEIAYVRARPGMITEDPKTRNPIIRYDETVFEDATDPKRRVTSMEVDLVVLCQALVPPSSQPEIAKRLGIELDDAGFVRIPDKLARPVDTTVAGIFACGCCLGPQDIPDSVIQASGVAARVAELEISRKVEQETF